MKKRVLVVTYYWPPISSPGVQRWLKFVKYLGDFNIETIVLTAKNATAPSTDNSLLADVPANVKVIHTTSLEPTQVFNILTGKKKNTNTVGLGDLKETNSPIKKAAKYLRSNIFIPDAKVGWYYNVRSKVLKLVKEHQIDTIITTGPPHTTHLIGRHVKKKTNVSWIADFRDPWTGIYYEKFLSRSQKSKHKNKTLERRVLEECDTVIAISNGLKQELAYARKDIKIIPNGYDRNDFSKSKKEKTAHFTIAYTGNLKSNQDIKAFWSALRNIVAEEKYKENLKVSITGNISESIFSTIKEYGLEHVVSCSPFVEHHVAIGLMKQANLLWLPIPQSEGNKLILTGKIFEYLASGTPILSIGPTDGDASTLLNECERDPMLAYTDERNIESYIKREMDYWYSHGQLSREHESAAHEKYERKNLTQTLSKLIHQS